MSAKIPHYYYLRTVLLAFFLLKIGLCTETLSLWQQNLENPKTQWSLEELWAWRHSHQSASISPVDTLAFFESKKKLGHLFFNQHLYQEAKIEYLEIIAKWDPYTRFGAESRFYLGQCYFKLNEFVKSAQVYQEITRTQFLPLTHHQLQERILNSYFFGIKELILNTKIPSNDNRLKLDTLESKMSQYIQTSVQSEAYLTKVADLYMQVSDTAKACEYWKLAEKQNQPAPSIYYNLSACKCSISEVSLEPFLLALDSSSLTQFQKGVIFNFLISQNNTREKEPYLKLLLHSLYFKSLPYDHQEEILTYLFRTSPNLNRLQILFSSLSLISQEKYSPEFQEILSVYQAYSHFLAGKPYVLDKELNLPRWEKSLEKFLKGKGYFDQWKSVPDSVLFLSAMEKEFWEIGQNPSEWIFDAAYVLLEAYEEIIQYAQQKKNQNQTILVGWQWVAYTYFRKLKQVQEQAVKWETQLETITLAPSTLGTLEKIKGKQKILPTLETTLLQNLIERINELSLKEGKSSYPEFWTELQFKWKPILQTTTSPLAHELKALLLMKKTELLLQDSTADSLEANSLFQESLGELCGDLDRDNLNTNKTFDSSIFMGAWGTYLTQFLSLNDISACAFLTSCVCLPRIQPPSENSQSLQLELNFKPKTNRESLETKLFQIQCEGYRVRTLKTKLQQN